MENQSSNITVLTSTPGALDQLNSFRYKPFIKISSLEQHVAYKIYGARRLLTKFGERVVLELEKDQLFLPSRFDKLSDDVIDSINKEGNYHLTNQGPAGSSYDVVFSQQDNYNMPYVGPAAAFYNNY